MYKLFFLFISLETYIKTCKTNKDCYNCTSNFQKNCLWKLNECEKNNNLKNNINKQDWWNSFSQCENQYDNKNNLYCGESKINDLGNEIQTISLKNIEEKYGIPGLLCYYYFEHEKKNNILRVEYNIKTSIYTFQFPKISIIFYFNNDTSSIIELTKNQLFDFKNIKKVEIYVLCFEQYLYLPFLFSFISKDNDQSDLIISLVVILSVIIFLIVVIVILHFFCIKNNEKNQNEIINENENNEINIITPRKRLDSINRKDIINELFISNIIEIKYQELIEKKQTKEKCSICLLDFQEETEKEKTKINQINLFKIKDENTIVMTPCKHYFHYKCLYTWLIKSKEDLKCPNCNYNLIEEEETQKIIINNNNSFSNNINSISRFGTRRNLNSSSDNYNRNMRLNLND